VTSRAPTIALLPWGNVLEDFLDDIGISFETFCAEFRGSYMFGYIDALRVAGVRTVLVCISSRFAVPSRFTHAPTGATIYVLPVPSAYRKLRSTMSYPYGKTVQEAFGEPHGARRLLFPALALIREVALYLTTPVGVLARILKLEGCESILCQEYEFPRFDVCVLLGKAIGLPVFATFQGGNYQHGHLEHYLRPAAIRRCAGLIIASRDELQRVRTCYHVPRTKIARIFNPIDLDAWRPLERAAARAELGIPSKASVVAWHGRVAVRAKGLDLLLTAWEHICRLRPERDLRLLLVGSGDEAPELRRLLATTGLAGVFWVDQFVHDPSAIQRYLSAADAYAFASRHEAFPVALIEAMACGLPVVATGVGGVVDILESGEAAGGVLVSRDDAPALAEQLGRLLDDSGTARVLGERARRRAQDFALEPIGQQLRSFLVGNSPPCSIRHVGSWPETGIGGTRFSLPSRGPTSLGG